MRCVYEKNLSLIIYIILIYITEIKILHCKWIFEIDNNTYKKLWNR